MELAPKGELFVRVIENGTLHEPDAQRYFAQLVRAVEYLHGIGVAHRDLKLARATQPPPPTLLDLPPPFPTHSQTVFAPWPLTAPPVAGERAAGC